MNELYSEVEQTKNRWDYGEGVGIIGKNRIGTEKDKEQDEKIDSNKEEIDKTKESLEDNENRDDAQQEQIDDQTTAGCVAIEEKYMLRLVKECKEGTYLWVRQ